MKIWKYIVWSVIAFAMLCLIYLGIRIPNLFGIKKLSGIKKFLLGILTLIILVGAISIFINFINAIVCIINLTMIWVMADIVFWIIKKMTKKSVNPLYIGWLVVIITIVSLSIGWNQAHNVWKTEYALTTSKNTPKLKIALIADSHLGTTFDAKGFEKNLQEIQKQNPDILVLVGDFVDDSTNRQEMIQASQSLGKFKTKYGTYFVFGNHDKGYYGSTHCGFSAEDLIEELTKNNVKVLQDETILIDDKFYLIGRKDAENKTRKSMKELTTSIDIGKYTIVLDHQPADYKNQEESKVDLVLSGHTHSGQLFPFNQIGKLIGANDAIYGHEKRGITDFIVTSGISDWAIKFKTGTKSEYVIITFQSETE